ncbi:hypothetical protein [Amycolatopsis sp. lyj-108]|uniref:hypothetical protein n=1 Tax=Amycolatopsis sp. lyj-108 TaxID=2789286 RepID=UPI0039794499
MTPETIALIDSLNAVSSRAKGIGEALRTGQMKAERQRQYAKMLSDLASLLLDHADLQDSPFHDTPSPPVPQVSPSDDAA